MVVIPDKPTAAQPPTLNDGLDATRLSKNVKNKRLAIGVIMALVISISIWQGSVFYAHWRIIQSVPADMRNTTPFPLYAPAPSRASIDQSSFSYAKGVVQFNCTIDGIAANVSEQSKPAGFSLSNFLNSDNITGSTVIATPNGNALIGTIGIMKVSILETEKTIVTITTRQAASTTTLEVVTKSLQRL